MAGEDGATADEEDLPVDVGHDVDEAADVLDEAAQALADGAAALVDEAAGVGHDPAQLLAERDEYLEALRRVKAEFENSKKRWERERAELVARAAATLVGQLLPVLDACDAAIGQGASDVEPVAKALREVLEREGLEQIPDQGEPFDPTLHEAVLFEAGDGGEQIVVESMRTGYQLKGQVLRAAMVKVQG